MAYEHDVFISYSRHKQWTPWTRDHFKDLLEAYLFDELGRDPKIFVDEHISVGQDWVFALGEHLAKSKILIAIFSTSYFNSPWCLHELDLMLARNHELAAELIIPVIVQDGERIPDQINRFQAVDLSEYRHPNLSKESKLYQDFGIKMKALAPHVKNAIHNAPEFNNAWLQQSLERFNNVYNNDKLEPEHYKQQPQKRMTTPRLSI